MFKYIFTVFYVLCLSTSVYAKALVIEHKLGSTTITKTPKRVVIIGYGALDTLDFFGIEPVAVAKVPAMPSYLSKYQQDSYTPVGSLFEPDFERIYNQKPDLIIIGVRAASKYKELSEIAPTVAFIPDTAQSYWESTQQQWRNLGKIFAINEQVEEQILKLNEEFTAIKAFNQKNKVNALTVMHSGGNISTFGKKSRFSAIYNDFGFTESVKSIESSKHGDLISFEFIREVDPQTLLILDRDKLKKESTGIEEMFDNALLKVTQAYKNKQVSFLDLEAWYLATSGVTATNKMLTDIKHSIQLED